jgi:hypothetical protein
MAIPHHCIKRFSASILNSNNEKKETGTIQIPGNSQVPTRNRT